MNLALAYDFETCGIPLWHDPSEDPRQPHIVQLAACLVDLDTRKTHASIDLIVKPEGWTIPDEVVAVHGITTEHALAVGVPESVAVRALIELWSTRKRIAFGESFDARIMRIALKRHWPLYVDLWKAGEAECVKRMAEKAMGWSALKLTEAYKHFTGKPLEGAHNAMPDVQGAMAVYFACLDGRTAAGT